ncbi:FMN reductase [Actinotalea sp. K2]|uniref:FMN reductase n=1 Tax=Actinotalea sp. K2 TaxID=2939438 RepID=UPI0020178A21|nr:FMN reductase [Actinotalea sp. K2]MCL3862890.1 FMN reductase [Actinotalea sp. K2]
MTRTLAVVTAGLRSPSSTRLLADRLTEAVVRAVREHGQEVVVEVVDLREHAHDLTNMMLTGFASRGLQDAIGTVTGADGVIAVTPIFSGSYGGLFKTFFDVVDDGSLAGTPVLIGATAGSARHSLALDHAVRPLFAYLRSVVVPTAVFAATEDFGRATGSTTTDTEPMAVRIDRAARELAALVVAREQDRRTGGPGTLTVSFEDLLSGQ